MIEYNAKILKIDAVNNLENVKIEEISKDAWLIQIDNKYYVAVKRKFNNGRNDEKKILLENAKCYVQELTPNLPELKLNVNYGDSEAVIVDMHGIDNFRFAKSLIFSDEDVRKMILKLNLLQEDKKYYRFGCSGARSCEYHPGGEVFESSILNGKDASGISQDISGYLPEGEEYSKSISLVDKDNIHLRDERIVYLHTAILKECSIEDSKCIYVKIEPTKDNVSFLDILTELAEKLNLTSYAIQICIGTDNTVEHITEIKGRVLKNMPIKPFEVLQEATDIGLEKIFKLENGETMYGVGTKYDRYEPEWEEFTGGRKYERRGHIHSTIIGKQKNQNNKHQVFHLRDVYVSLASKIQVVLTPVDNVYKIYPVYKKQNEFFCKTTDKNIKSVINNIRLKDGDI